MSVFHPLSQTFLERRINRKYDDTELSNSVKQNSQGLFLLFLIGNVTVRTSKKTCHENIYLKTTMSMKTIVEKFNVLKGIEKLLAINSLVPDVH